MSLYHDNGTVRWRDGVLYFPTLPILDNYGDVTGSDGVSLVHFDADGKKYPIIPCQNMKPIFSMQLVGSMYLLMVSERGGISVRDTSAIPVAEIFLNDTVQRVNGTFLPISQPVVNGHRFYLLTEFVPSLNTDLTSTVLNLQRLYAIDIHHRMLDIITVAWYFDFEMETAENKSGEKDTKSGFSKTTTSINADAYRKAFRQKQESIIGKQILLWDQSNQVVYVTLPPPYTSNTIPTFWGLKDTGNSTSLAFRSDLDVTHMAIFEANDDMDKSAEYNVEPSILWVSLVDGRLCSIAANGSLSRCIDTRRLFSANPIITSKISLIRRKGSGKDILIFGINVSNQSSMFKELVNYNQFKGTNNTNYVVAIDTASAFGHVMWVVPVPDDFEVKGQITGAGGAIYQEKDQLVVFASTVGLSAKIFTIY